MWVDLNNNGQSQRRQSQQPVIENDWLNPQQKADAPNLVKLYEGQWRNDHYHGRGTLYYHKDGGKYEGEFDKGRRHGWGVMFYPDGTRYEGEWENGERCGQGVMWLTNGDRFEGLWRHDMKNGPGRYHYTSLKRIYEGEWANNVAKCGYLRDVFTETSPLPKVFFCF